MVAALDVPLNPPARAMIPTTSANTNTMTVPRRIFALRFAQAFQLRQARRSGGLLASTLFLPGHGGTPYRSVQ